MGYFNILPIETKFKEKNNEHNIIFRIQTKPDNIENDIKFKQNIHIHRIDLLTIKGLRDSSLKWFESVKNI